jgi:hypothetical protein
MAKRIKGTRFLKPGGSNNTCADLTRSMYGNIDSSFQSMKTFKNIWKGEGINLKQIAIDPCVFYE